MTEIMVSNSKGRKGIAKALKIDMTPLVDLAFLLITFFIFTRAIGEAKAMKLFMPADGESALGESSALTLILGADNKVLAYAGNWNTAKERNQMMQTSYSLGDGIGNIVRAKQTAMQHNRSNLMVLIKPTAGASYENIVNALDEMLINGVKRYAIVEPTAEEMALLTPGS
ncbi:MAG: hypothetical protein JWP69_2070 [Flaviaesturariibacter sp.]|nr:hypothetical protein [Flaviaesturariibacter sp.]